MRYLLSKHTVVVLAVCLPAPAFSQDQVPYPEVPMRLTDGEKDSKNDSAANESDSSKDGAGPGERGAKNIPETSRTVEAVPGRNILIPVARGHMNRFITPFQNPRFKTTTTKKKAPIETAGSSLFVGPGTDKPVTLFVYERGAPDGPALSLSLVPRSIPPRSIRFRFPQGVRLPSPRRTVNSSGSASSKAEEHVSRIRQVLAATARGDVPQGYSLRNPDAKDPASAGCSHPGLAVRLQQVLEGSRTQILIARATSKANQAVEFDERYCVHDGVIGAAAYPRVRLDRGDQTEVYVMRRKGAKAESPGKRERPLTISTTPSTRAPRPSPKDGGEKPAKEGAGKSAKMNNQQGAKEEGTDG